MAGLRWRRWFVSHRTSGTVRKVEDAPAAALAFLDRILAHPATEHSTRNRARSLRQVLIAVDSGAAASTQHKADGVPVLLTGEILSPREVECCDSWRRAVPIR